MESSSSGDECFAEYPNLCRGNFSDTRRHGEIAWLADVGSPLWLVMGAMALCGALCYGELAARFPEAGDGYVYLREAYGRPWAFLYGWMAFLVMDPGLTATLAVGLASYAGYILNLSPGAIKAGAIAAIFLVAAANIRGVRLGAWPVRWLTALKLGLLAVVLFWGFAFQLGGLVKLHTLSRATSKLDHPHCGARGRNGWRFFSLGGWWDVSKLAGEVRDPAHTLPKAMAYGVVIVTLVNILTTAVFTYLHTDGQGYTSNILVPNRSVAAPARKQQSYTIGVRCWSGSDGPAGLPFSVPQKSAPPKILKGPSAYCGLYRANVFPASRKP